VIPSFAWPLIAAAALIRLSGIRPVGGLWLPTAVFCFGVLSGFLTAMN
jgi:hypothetical protein